MICVANEATDSVTLSADPFDAVNAMKGRSALLALGSVKVTRADLNCHSPGSQPGALPVKLHATYVRLMGIEPMAV